MRNDENNIRGIAIFFPPRIYRRARDSRIFGGKRARRVIFLLSLRSMSSPRTPTQRWTPERKARLITTILSPAFSARFLQHLTEEERTTYLESVVASLATRDENESVPREMHEFTAEIIQRARAAQGPSTSVLLPDGNTVHMEMANEHTDAEGVWQW